MAQVKNFYNRTDKIQPASSKPPGGLCTALSGVGAGVKIRVSRSPGFSWREERGDLQWSPARLPPLHPPGSQTAEQRPGGPGGPAGQHIGGPMDP